MNQSSLRVCWMGGTRYANPLDVTALRKWEALAQLDADLFVIGFSDSVMPRRFTQIARFYLLPDLPLPVMRYAMFFVFAPLIALWLIFRHGVNVLVAQSPYEGAAAAWTKNVARIFGRKVALIVESHGNFEEDIFSQRAITFKALYRAMMWRLARYAFSHADALRVISTSTREQIARWTSGKPLEQFMTWTDAASFHHTPRAIPLNEAVDIVYPGVLIPRKGIHFLIDAFAAIAADFPKSHLWLVGRPDDPDYVTRLHQQIKQANLETRITFTGNVSQAELADYMGRARVAVLPSTSEGLGRVVVEAMMCGTPVIGSRVGGIPDMITDGENGLLVPAGDTSTLTAALRKMLSNELDVVTMGQNAQRFAQQFFSPQLYVDGYRRLFEHARQSLR